MIGSEMKKSIQFLKDWTLPVSIATGAVLYLLFAFIPALDNASSILAPVFNAILPLFMFLVLYVTFCKVDYHKLLPVKWHLWVGLFQIVSVIVIVGWIMYFHTTGKALILLEAILTCIIGPCASAAAVVTQKIGGDLTEMVTYTFISNFICAILIPICFPLIETNMGFTFTGAFLLILNKVSLVLIVPMLLAYITKHLHLLRPLYRWIINVNDLSYYLWCASLLIVSGTTVKNIVHANVSVSFLLLIAISSLVLCLLQFIAGKSIGAFFHNAVNSGQALGQKNTTFAIWIANTYLNPLSTVGPGCYILWQNIINSVEIWHYSKSNKRTN